MKELLESLGTLANSGKPTVANQSTSPAIQSKQLSSSLPEEVAALSVGSEDLNFDDPSHSVAVEMKHLDSSTADSVSQLTPSLINGLCDSEEQSSSLCLSQPRAASLVPEPQKTDAMTVAQSVSVGQPHPPASFHHLPLSPELSPNPPQTLPGSPPAITQMPVSVPEPMATHTSSTQQTVARSLSAPVPVSVPDCNQHMHGSSLNGLEAQPSSTSDFSNSAIPQDSQVLLSPSADHINFFSAREKFKGMSQDSKSPQLRACGKDQQTAVQEVLTSDGKEEEKRKVMLLHVPNILTFKIEISFVETFPKHL